MIKLLMVIFVLLSNGIFAQEREIGIKFETGLSWKEIQAKAKTENKPIFMDCFATWCGPCKMMEDEIFSKKEVGDYFNLHFINVKVQMDRTSKDTKFVRDWYADVQRIISLYKIEAYPTFLFFSQTGKATHQICGTSQTDSEFISKASASLNPEKQYFTLLSDWEGHNRDSAYLIRAFLAAKVAGDSEHARAIINAYINCLQSPISVYNIDMIDPYIISESDKGFDLYLHNASEIDRVMGNGVYAEATLAAVIFKEEAVPFLNRDKDAPFKWEKTFHSIEEKYPTVDNRFLANRLDGFFQNEINKEIHAEIDDKKNVLPADWVTIAKVLRKRFPGYDCGHLLLDVEIRYYYDRKSWEACAHAAITNIDKYGYKLKPESINDMIWRCIFFHSENKRILEKALRYMEDVVKATPKDVDDLDTYANLLYKTGHTQEGIEWEIKAIRISEAGGGEADIELKNNLKRMQQGEPTWGNAAENS